MENATSEREDNSRARRQPPRGVPWNWVLVYLAVAALVVTSGFLLMKHLQGNVKEQAQEELAAVADLKANEISKWYEERRADATVLMETTFFSQAAREFLADPNQAETRSDLLAWMETCVRNYDYHSVFLLDTAGEAALAVRGSGEAVGDYARGLALEAMSDGETVISDIHYGEDESLVRIDLVAPIPSTSNGGTPAAGAVLLRIDPYIFLYPLIQTWPTLSDSAETLLVRAEDGEVVFLNEPRHQEGDALTMKFSVEEEDLPAAKAARGFEGVTEGTDYRGVEVLAAVRRVPGTAWYVIAKEDASEVYATVTARTWLAVGLTGLMVIALGFLVGLFWIRKKGQFYRRQYVMEGELRASEERYRLLFQRTPIGVFQYDRDLHITDCNDRFVEILRSSRERLLGLDIDELRYENVVPAIRTALEGIEGLYEGPYHATTSDAAMHVSMRTTPLRDSEGTIIAGVGIVEDISERMEMQAELREREIFLRRLTGNMLDLISQIDLEGNFVYLSPSNERVLGYREADLLGANVMDIVHPDDLPAVVEAYTRSNHELVPGKVEFRARKADDTYMWVESVGNPLHDEAGELIGAIFTTRDISDRKRAEEEAERGRMLLFSAFEMVPATVILLAPDYTFRYANRYFRHTFGDPGERKCHEVLHGRSTPCEECRPLGIIETGMPFSREWSNESGKHFLVHYYPFEDVDGGRAVLEMGIDITDRKRMEQHLERLNRCFLELGTSALENAIMIMDAGQEIMQAAGMHYSRMDNGRFYIYHTAWDSTGFEHLEEAYYLLCHTAIAENSDEPIVVEDLPARGYDGFLPEVAREGLGSYLACPVKAHGVTVGFLGLLRREIGAFSSEERDLMSMLARAIAVEEERLAHEEELRDFIDIASHELRHPMTVIKGYAATLRLHQDRMDETMKRGVLADIDKGVNRLEKLVYQLLDTARIERNKLALEKAEADVGALLEKTVAEMQDRIPARDFVLDLPVQECRAEADAERIGQVLVILMENAVNYSPHDSPVDMALAMPEEGKAVVSVMDRGVGVPEEDRDRIFERFYQVGDPTHHSSEGIGLGLHIAREIIEAHGGEIWYEPREGGGSIFCFTLPCL